MANSPTVLSADDKALEAPVIELQGVELASVGIQGAQVAINLLVINPNDVDIVVESIRYQLQLNSAQVKNGAIEQEVAFPAKQRRNIRLKVNIGYDTELPRIIAALNNPESTLYEISGTVKLKNMDTPFDFSHQDNLALPSG